MFPLRRTGTGIEKLVDTLAANSQERSPARHRQAPVVYRSGVPLHGIGTVVQGTLTGGSMRRGQQIVV